jgi:multidrug resistance efflux pump
MEFDVKSKRAMITLAVPIVIFAVAIFGKWELKISNKSELLPGSQAVIRAQVAGTITQISVDEGDAVTTNQIIARLDNAGYRANLMEVDAEITKWQAELELLLAGPLDEEIKRLRQLVEKARMRASFAEKEFERIDELYTKQMVSGNEYETASEELSMRRKEIEQAESDLDVLMAGYRPEKVKAARAEIQRLEASREFLGEKITRTEITSPITGIVATRHLRDKLNEYMEIGDEICMIVNYRTLLLEMPVSEKDVTHLQVGQRVKFRARSMPQVAFHGKVTAIADVATSNSDRKVFVMTSEVDNPGLILHPGMTGNAKVYCGKKRFIYLWTRKIIRFIRVEFWW